MWEIIESGMMTTVQDLGRHGYSWMGIPPSGAFDAFSLKVGNFLLKNDLGEAGLEILLGGLRMKALSEMAVAITGGDLSPTLNGRPLNMWRVIWIREGDILHSMAAVDKLISRHFTFKYDFDTGLKRLAQSLINGKDPVEQRTA